MSMISRMELIGPEPAPDDSHICNYCGAGFKGKWRPTCSDDCEKRLGEQIEDHVQRYLSDSHKQADGE